MKKFIISITVGLLLLAVGCNKITNINTNPKQPTKVPGNTLFSSAELKLSNLMTSTNVNRNIFRLLDQYWTETTYTDESNYNLKTRAIPDNVWDILYRDVLANLKNSSEVIASDPNIDASVKKNDQACIEILNVYAYSTLVNIFGDVPYTQALDFKTPNPKYDDANTIYKDLIKRLNTALGNLDTGAGGFGSADLIYGGDISSWMKFGYSLDLRLAMTLADVSSDQSLVQSTVQMASPKAFMSQSDNAMFTYLKNPPNTNPLWVDLVQSGRHDFVVANTIVDMMNNLNDPRRQYYFTTAPDTTAYIGGVYAQGSQYANYSHPSDMMKDPTFPGDLMDYTQVEFLRAEAAARGYSVDSTAADYYKNAIKQSILHWGGTDAEFNTYYAQSAVNWSTAAGNYKEKIGVQEWIALYNHGMAEWTTWRRLDYPQLKAPSSAQSVIPLRYTYPVQEQNLNQKNYEAASSAIGGDKVSTKLFWDKY